MRKKNRSGSILEEDLFVITERGERGPSLLSRRHAEGLHPGLLRISPSVIKCDLSGQSVSACSSAWECDTAFLVNKPKVSVFPYFLCLFSVTLRGTAGAWHWGLQAPGQVPELGLAGGWPRARAVSPQKFTFLEKILFCDSFDPH